MIRIIVLILGATFFYTGLLVFERDSLVGISALLIGIILVAKPVLNALLFIRANAPKGSPRRDTPKPKRKTHLSVVKPRDDDRHEDKPTIH